MVKQMNRAPSLVLAAKLTFASLFFGVAHAGIPVMDLPQTIQATISAIEQVHQTAKQLDQYRTQLDQLSYQMRNTSSLDQYEWDRAVSTMRNIISLTDTIGHHTNAAGSLDKYLDRFGDVEEYRNIDCFAENGCKVKMGEIRANGSEAQRVAADASMRGISAQQEKLEADAMRLERLQSSAEGAEGRLQAMQYANQFAGDQSAQLLQIRSLLVQQNAMATAQLQAEYAERSLNRAAEERALQGKAKESSGKGF
jgi:P-type conjugative transfer protein TrbJ